MKTLGMRPNNQLQPMTPTNNLEMKQVPAEHLRFAVSSPINLSEDGKSFTMAPYAGQIFQHAYWGNMAFDLKKLNLRKKAVPALFGHDWSKPVGVITKLDKKEMPVKVHGELIENADTLQLKAMKDKGLEWECSLGFDPDGEIEFIPRDVKTKVNGQDFEGPGHIFRGNIHEVSFTHFGAVPGTETEFKRVSISNFFNKEDSMSDAQIQIDLAKSKEEGRNEYKALFSKMSELCSDKVFVADCVMEGLSFEQFQAKLVKKLQSDVEQRDVELIELQKKIDQKPASVPATDGPKFAPATSPAAELDFVAKARHIAKEKGIDFRTAYVDLIKSEPELYKSYKAKINGGK